jgi:hypothetical protein
MLEGVNSTMIYCKNFSKYYNVPPVQHYDNKKITRVKWKKKAKINKLN